MWFRNLTLFRFSERTAVSLKSLGKKLEAARLRACGPLELGTRGFVSPLGRNEEVLLHQVGAFSLLALGSEDKLLPSQVVNEAVAVKVDAIVKKTGRQVGGRERKQLKDEVITDLLPRAFVRTSRLFAYLDSKNGWLVLDTASSKAAEAAVSEIRSALGTFPAVPLTAETSPKSHMTDWLKRGKLPPGLSLGDECELRDPGESGAVIRCRRQDLETDEVREHLKSGKHVFQLGLTFEERLSFVLGEDLVVRKLRFLDSVLDELDDSERDSDTAELDARFALMTLELEPFLARIEKWFGLSRPMDRK